MKISLGRRFALHSATARSTCQRHSAAERLLSRDALAIRTMADIDDTENTGTAGLIPNEPDLDALREAAAECTACPLYRDATQTVFGEGPEHARVMFVGEQPGDAEDLAGHPFVGGAGKLLDRCLEAAGVDRGRAYVTNTVKQFK